MPLPYHTHACPHHLPHRDRTGTPPAEPHNTNGATAQQPTPGQPNTTPKSRLMKKKANINIATLNINGASAPTANLTLIDKWARINSTIKQNKLAILAVQETHLDNESVDAIERCFGKSLDLKYSSDPDSPRTKAGVAIVINKALIPINDIHMHVL